MVRDNAQMVWHQKPPFCPVTLNTQVCQLQSVHTLLSPTLMVFTHTYSPEVFF